MTLKEMEYLLVTAQTHSITEAAKRLYVAQPSMTHAIQSVEKEIGFPIFVRSRTGVVITPQGQEFLEDIRTVYEQMAAVEHKYIEKSADRKMFSVSLQHFPLATEAFVSFLHSEMGTSGYHTKILEGRTREVIQNVASGRSEIGILHFLDQSERVILKEIRKAKLEFYSIKRLRPYLIFGKRHPLHGKGAVTEEELFPYPMLRYDQGMDGSLNVAEEGWFSMDADRKITISDGLTMLHLLQKTDAYTISTGAPASFLLRHDLVGIPLCDGERMKLGWIKKNDTILQPLAKQYLRLLNQFIGE